MDRLGNLTTIKIIHTVIWAFFNLVLLYMAYAVIINKIDMLFSLGFLFILSEAILLLIFKQQCPLTVIARRYSDSDHDNFDIYLPNWLARYNKIIYSIFFAIILLGFFYRIANK